MRATKRYEIARSWKDIRWAVAALLVAGALAAAAGVFQEGRGLVLVIAIPVALVVLGIISEIVYQACNYVVFDEDWLDVSEDEWGFRGKWHYRRGRTRLPYADVISIDVTDGVVEIQFKIDPLKPRFRWPPVEYHGRIAILRFKPRRPDLVRQELEERVSVARNVEPSSEGKKG